MTHADLCERAIRWLRGQRCDPVLHGIASSAEIPDAIGWGSDGSIVIECKISIGDLLRDKRKNHAEKRMGDRRLFLCPFGLVAAGYIEKHFPDHGLLSPQGRKMTVLRTAPIRQHPNHRSEVRYLRFALIHARSNLLKLGCGVDLAALCQFFGEDGISLPAEKRPFYRPDPLPELVRA
jgi:hypothetical protein